ncbi:hypothetical protein LPW11_04430 [Geomonas sp. RF6]|uniref:hypothetical protein n=1 Tax=Geomonas sp. RF6 TaxID=2897342 RepID=UPI001E52B895|nr:hypothetical protein [Geomonas sp. RF6]UFS71446.1 hypothetical protein LPW11_04430 [Geomonas sp. RF6]
MPDPTKSVQSPFLDVKSFFTTSPSEPHPATSKPTSAPPSNTPFVSVYEMEEGTSSNPRGEEYVAFLNELYNEEFDEALFELMADAAALHEERVSRFSGEMPAQDPAAERFLEAHFEPLTRELEGVLDALVQKYGQTRGNSVDPAELEAFIDNYASGVEVPPAFENFLGGAFWKLRQVAAKAASFAGDLALGPIFSNIKSLIQPFLKEFLRRGISRLSPQLQPLAQKVAERLGILKELEDPESESEAEVSGLQHEFDRQLAELLFAPGEVEQELEVSRALSASRSPADDRLAQLDHARERFVNGLASLKEGEEPAPLLENFLPAILPVLKVGIKLAGRQRIIGFLAGFLAKLIGKLVGPENAPALSRAIVDAGFKLINFEASPQAEALAAPAAVAATVEDTVRRVAALPEYVLEDQELLEAAALEAFEQAASANLPPILSEEAYQRRPDLREAKIRGTWVSLPLHGRKRYKKFVTPGTLRARITPQAARQIETFGGVSLAEFLEEQLAVPGGIDVEAEVHLYETLPGGTVPDVTRLEKGTPGLGDGTQRAYGQLHPLTPQAAGVLLGEPGLGRAVGGAAVATPHATQPGERLYYLNVKGGTPISPAGGTARPRLRRPSGLKLVLDFPGRQIRAYLYLSEVKSQNVAVKLRQQAHLGSALAPLRAVLDRDLFRIGSGAWGRIKLIHEAVAPHQATGGALGRVPSVVVGTLVRRLREYMLKGIAAFLKTPQELVAATEAPADGCTLLVKIDNPPGLELLRQALKGRIPSLASLHHPAPEPNVSITVTPGYQHG